MVYRSESRIGATCALAGSVLLFVGTYLHPLKADPNEAVSALAEYAADHLWVASHLTQLAGVALIVAALLFLAQQLEAASGTGWSRIAAGGAIASLAVTAALQAVDGIALKVMVEAWAVAPAAQKEGAFHAAFAVRQVEIGSASMLSLLFGLTVTVRRLVSDLPNLRNKRGEWDRACVMTLRGVAVGWARSTERCYRQLDHQLRARALFTFISLHEGLYF